jgi:hypothetical protein
MVRSSSASGFTGFVNPQGLPTVAYFQYGLDSAYSAAADVSYTDSTPQQQIGSAFSPQAVTASVSGLVPNALYHVRLVASNSAGTTYGPDQTFKTQQDPAPASPALGKTFDVAGVQGLVLIEINGKLVPLTEVRQIPVGSVIDALHGSLNLTAALGKKGKTENGTFGGAVFKLTQLTGGPTKGLTILSLLEGAFPGAPSFSSCKAKAADSSSPTASAAALSSKVLQTLHASAHGHFRTRGRFAAATVRGTKWTTTDRCDGTLVSVQLHTVTVTDFVRRITVLVHQGHSYLAKARP